VIGSIAASLYTSRLTALLPPGLPGRALTAAHGSVGGAAIAAQHLTQAGLTGAAHALNNAAVAAFMHSLSGACLVAAGVTTIGVLLVAIWLPNRPRTQQPATLPAASAVPHTAAEQAGFITPVHRRQTPAPPNRTGKRARDGRCRHDRPNPARPKSARPSG